MSWQNSRRGPIQSPGRAAQPNGPAPGSAGARLPDAATRLAALQQGIGNRAVRSRLADCPAIAACPTGGACHACPFRGRPGAPSAQAGFQPKLEIGPAGDRYEQEADRLAEQIVGGSAADVEAIQPSPVSTLQRDCTACGPDDEQTVQRAPAATAAPETSGTVHSAPAPTAVGPGQPLPAATRGFFESRIGHAFGDVQVHADAAADASARAVRARAYTVGRNIAFAAGQYAPETTEGRRLLAHELTHVVQQTGGAARLQRQPAEGTTPTGTPAPVPTSPGWAGCDPGRHAALDAELADAIEWVTAAIADLKRPKRPIKTAGALREYLTADDAAVTGTIIPKLELILADLSQGPSNFRCQTEDECKAEFPGGANAYNGKPITLCPGYFAKPEHMYRVTTLIHEAGHNAGLSGNVVEWQKPFPGLSTEARLGNTESYAMFVRDNRYPMLPPLQQPSDNLSLGFGASPSSGGARYVVSAEYDPRLRQRVFRLFDLHLGTRIDFDTQGRFVDALTIGPRIFSPIAPGRTNVFLDLRVGAAVVYENDRPSVGPTTGARLSLAGKVGAAIDWQRVWGIFKDDPTIDTITIRGVVRW